MNSNIVITIDRDFGAEGHEIGFQLAARLGIKLYDKDILGKAVLKKGQDEISLMKADESVSKTDYNPYFPSLGFARKSDQLFELEKGVIRDVAESESCIIVGRLSDYILRDKSNLLRVYIYAPFEFRVKNIQNKYNSSEVESKKIVRRKDIVRRDYRNYYSNGKYKLYSNKDVFLNREVFGIDGCVEILETAAKERIKKLKREL